MSQYANPCTNMINQYLLSDQRSGNRAKMANAANSLTNQNIFNEMVSLASLAAEMEASKGFQVTEQLLLDIVRRVLSMYLCVFISQNPSLIYDLPGMSTDIINQNLMMLNQAKREIQQFLNSRNTGYVQPVYNSPANTTSGMFSKEAVSIVSDSQPVTHSSRGPVYRGSAEIPKPQQETPRLDAQADDVLQLGEFKMNRDAHYVKINNIPYPISLVTDPKQESKIPDRFVIETQTSTLLDIGMESAFNSSYVKLKESGKKALITSHFVATPVLFTQSTIEVLSVITGMARLTDVIVALRSYRSDVTTDEQMRDILFLDSYILNTVNAELSKAVGSEYLCLDSALEDYLSVNDYLAKKTATQSKAFIQYDTSKMSLFLDINELNEILKETFIDYQSDGTEYTFITKAVKIATVDINQETFFYTQENKRISFEETPWLSDIAEELFKNSSEAYLAIGNFKYRITKSYLANNYYIEMF